MPKSSCVVVLKSFGGKYNIGFVIPIEFPSQRKKNIIIGQETTKLCFNIKIPKSSRFVVLKSFGGKCNIGFGIPIEFPSQRKKIIQIGKETTKLCFN